MPDAEVSIRQSLQGEASNVCVVPLVPMAGKCCTPPLWPPGREAFRIWLPLPQAGMHMRPIAVGHGAAALKLRRFFILLCARLWGSGMSMLPGSKRLCSRRWGELRRKLQQLQLPLPPWQPEETTTLPNRCVHECVTTLLSKCPAACESFVTGWLIAELPTSSTLSLVQQADVESASLEVYSSVMQKAGPAMRGCHLYCTLHPA